MTKNKTKKQIAVNVHYLPLPMLSFYKNMGYSMEDYPNSFNNYTCEVSLPVYYDLSNEQVISTLATVFRGGYEGLSAEDIVLRVHNYLVEEENFKYQADSGEQWSSVSESLNEKGRLLTVCC